MVVLLRKMRHVVSERSRGVFFFFFSLDAILLRYDLYEEFGFVFVIWFKVVWGNEGCTRSCGKKPRQHNTKVRKLERGTI